MIFLLDFWDDFFEKCTNPNFPTHFSCNFEYMLITSISLFCAYTQLID